jgi:signal transduction histidine kinase
MSFLRFAGAFVLPCLIASAQSPEAVKAEALVKQAVAFAKANGVEKLLQETNNGSGKFHVAAGSDLYIFIYDQQGVVKAIGYNTGALVGKNRIDMKDPDGVMVIQGLLKLANTKGKGWFDYKYPDPTDNKVKVKSSYVELYEGLVIGSGIYKD